MFTALYRIIKYGWLDFWRNGWLSTATISIIVIALIVFEGLILFRVVTQTALSSVQNKIDISVYFKADTSEDQILNIQKNLKNLPEVKAVEYISRDRALDIFKARHEGETAITQSIGELQANPLLASLNIKAYDPSKYGVIANYLENSTFKDSFDNITYSQNEMVISRLSKIINTTEKGAMILIVVLSLVAVLVTFNTIRLAIYSSREEIGIMRLVGASNSFIRGPYLMEGVIYGLTAAVLSFAVFTPIIYFSSPYLKVFIPEMDLWSYFRSNFFSVIGYQVLFGIGLGVVSSIIAIRKYLRV